MTSTNCGFNNRDDLLLWGPTLQVQVGLDPTYDPRTGQRPNLSPTPWAALVDTGAMESCIDSALAATLGLPIIDRQRISGVGGVVEVNRHLAHIYIPSLNWAISGSFAGVHLAAGGQQHHVLIGRNMLYHYRMDYDGRTGNVILMR